MNDKLIEQARHASASDIVNRLNLPHAGGKKYACPVCPSTDALQVRDDEAVCYSSNHPGNRGAGVPMDTIDLVEAARGCGFREAVQWIVGNDDNHNETPEGGHAPQPSTGAPDTPDTPRIEPTTAFLERVLRHEDSYLSDAGARYLETRGLSRETAEQFGIVDFTRDEWGAWCARAPDDDWLVASGLVVEHDSGPSLHPYYDHFLAIPYWGPGEWTFAPPDANWREEGQLETVRFRTTSSRDQPKMMSLTSDGPSTSSVPYMEASVGAAGRYRWPLFVVEGELDALSIWEVARWPVVATNSASRWPRSWCAPWEDERIPDVIVVAEGDEGGQQFASLVRQRCLAVHGESWANEHLIGVNLRDGYDCNDLLVERKLADRLDAILRRVDAAHDGPHPMHGAYCPHTDEWGASRSRRLDEPACR